MKRAINLGNRVKGRERIGVDKPEHISARAYGAGVELMSASPWRNEDRGSMFASESYCLVSAPAVHDENFFVAFESFESSKCLADLQSLVERGNDDADHEKSPIEV